MARVTARSPSGNNSRHSLGIATFQASTHRYMQAPAPTPHPPHPTAHHHMICRRCRSKALSTCTQLSLSHKKNVPSINDNITQVPSCGPLGKLKCQYDAKNFSSLGQVVSERLRKPKLVGVTSNARPKVCPEVVLPAMHTDTKTTMHRTTL